MARGFSGGSSSLGSGTTDVVTTAYASMPTVISGSVWIYPNGHGGSDKGRIFDMGTLAVIFMADNQANAPGEYTFGTNNSTNWAFTAPSQNNWHQIGFVFNTSTLAKPDIYIDGSAVSVGVNGGETAVSAGTWRFGNRSDSARGWDGLMAEGALWGVGLDASEFAALGKGYSPLLVRRTSLVVYEPMLRDNTNPLMAAASITGTAVQAHSRVIMPAPRPPSFIAAGGGGGGGGVVGNLMLLGVGS